MKILRSQNSISLTGGLGNQLFQLAAGLYLSKNEQLMIEWRLGSPRLNKFDLPEITSFMLPSTVVIGKRSRKSFLASKAHGYVLRQGINLRIYERIGFIRELSKIFASLVISVYNKRLTMLKVSNGVGYSKITSSDRGRLLIGYFQTHLWMEDIAVFNAMHKIELKDKSTTLDYFAELAEVEKPLIVHIRLGDYKNENLFGIPSTEYYISAIQRLFNSDKYGKIWIFSDEPDLAFELFGSAIPNEVRWIHNEGESAAQTLEIMRHGKGYVIANSTFSWWAAFLSYTADPEVIAPDPWFRHLDNPKDLLPPTWHVIPGWPD